MIIRILALGLVATALAQYQNNGRGGQNPYQQQQQQPYNMQAGQQGGSQMGQYQQNTNNNQYMSNNYGKNTQNNQRAQLQVQQQQYGSNQQQTNTQQRGIVNQILTPYNQTSSADSINGGGVTVQFQLRSYSDPGSALPNSLTCVCPSGASCDYLATVPRCNFGFSFIISSPDESVRYLSTGFFTLVDGQLPPANTIVSGERWDQNYVVQLPSKPSAIDIMVHHLGPVLHSDGSAVAAYDKVTHVDTFVVPLNNVVPAVGGVQSMNQQQSFDGKLLNTKLSISYAVACTGSLIGPDCDLKCNQSSINTNVAACQSNRTSFFSVCQYSGSGQVDNCKACPWGIREDTYCVDDSGNVLDPKHAGVVDTSFRTATIILGVICGILLILFLLALLLACILRRRQSEDREMYSASSQPLIKPVYQPGDMPTPQPRSQPPSLDARPIKSALRRPMVPSQQPMNSTLNDTRDTSFSTEVPMRPSRSQVV